MGCPRAHSWGLVGRPFPNCAPVQSAKPAASGKEPLERAGRSGCLRASAGALQPRTLRSPQLFVQLSFREPFSSTHLALTPDPFIDEPPARSASKLVGDEAAPVFEISACLQRSPSLWPGVSTDAPSRWHTDGRKRCFRGWGSGTPGGVRERWFAAHARPRQYGLTVRPARRVEEAGSPTLFVG